MVTIYDNENGDVYNYDEDSMRIFRNDIFLPETVAEPVFSGNSEDSEPIFVGIYLKGKNMVITLSGNRKKIVDNNQIS